MKFNTVTIRDPALNNIEGATLLVPDGWKVEGGFVWMPLFLIQANLLLRLSDPETGAATEMLPLQQYAWLTPPAPMPIGQNYLGSIHLPPPQHPAEFVQRVWMQDLLRHLRGARLERVDDLPEYAAEVARGLGGGPGVWGTRLRYTYQYGGRGWEEDVYVTLVFPQPGGPVRLWYGFGHTMRAPAGMLDRMTPLLSVPIQTRRDTLEWSAALEFVRNLYRQNRANILAEQIRINQMWIQHREEMRQMHQQAFAERQASQVRQNFAMREILGGIETYINPFESRTVELPPGYGQYWVSNKGQVIGSDNQSFDPRSDNTQEWRSMERYRP